EFTNDVAEFFDDRAREEEIVAIRLPGGQTYSRPLTYRGTDYGQWTDIWRLGLPTRSMGAPEFAGRVIKFDRVVEGKTVVYQIAVSDPGAAEVRDWQRRSSTRGTTGGAQGRDYGYW